MNPKEVAGIWAANQVEDGMRIGLGTGSTAFFAIQRIGQRVRDGLRVTATATSLATEELASQWNIPLQSLPDIGVIDMTIDGADEVTPELYLIKGGGGALFREKMVALRSCQMLVIADPSKPVDTLGAFPLPVEVVPFGHQLTRAHLSSLNLNPVLRKTDQGKDYLTDNRNVVYDCHAGTILDPEALHHQLKSLTGVVETGLFLGLATRVVIGKEDGTVEIMEKNG